MINQLHFYYTKVPLGLITSFDKGGYAYHKYVSSIRDEGLHRPLSLFTYKDRLLQVCNGGSRYFILKYILEKPDTFKVPCLIASIYDWSDKPIKKIDYETYQKISGYNYKIGFKQEDTFQKLIFFEKKSAGFWEGVERFVRKNHVEKPVQLYKQIQKSGYRSQRRL